jgi:Skp family chaperone for outer membrane proteins
VIEVQANISKVQKKSAAIMKKLKKQTEEKISRGCNEHQAAIEQLKVS